MRNKSELKTLNGYKFRIGVPFEVADGRLARTVSLRNYEGKRMLVINSFTDKPVQFAAPAGFDLGKGKLVLSNYDVDSDKTLNTFETKPYETRVYLFD